MYRNILIATDGSRLALRGIREGVKLAAALGAKVAGVYVIAPYVEPMYGEGAIYVPAISPSRYKKTTEQQARKASIKLAFPLVFLIFPALLLIILGPAGIQLMKALVNEN